MKALGKRCMTPTSMPRSAFPEEVFWALGVGSEMAAGYSNRH